jgi:hypothetical protein
MANKDSNLFNVATTNVQSNSLVCSLSQGFIDIVPILLQIVLTHRKRILILSAALGSVKTSHCINEIIHFIYIV